MIRLFRRRREAGPVTSPEAATAVPLQDEVKKARVELIQGVMKVERRNKELHRLLAEKTLRLIIQDLGASDA